MANLKEIRIRIASVKSTRKITSAMKMVAAAKLRKSQDKIIRMRPYANKLDNINYQTHEAQSPQAPRLHWRAQLLYRE